MSPRAVGAWSSVHKWTSLVCTPVLLFMCLTGLPLIFHHEIDAALGGPAWTAAHPNGPRLGLDAILADALARRPGEVPTFMSFDDDRPVINVTTGARADVPEARMHFASFDATSGDPVPPPPVKAVTNFLLELHRSLFLGLSGRLLLGTFGLVFLAAIVSGVVVYAPFMRKLPFGAIRAGRTSRLAWLDLHNLLGVLTVVWALAVGATGVINTLADPIYQVWKADQLAAFNRGPPGGSAGARAPVGQVVAEAQAAAPGMQLQFVAFPGGAFSTAGHYVVFLHGSTPLTTNLLTAVLVDASTGRLAAVRRMPWYAKAVSLSQPLHFGDYGGEPLKLIWAALDLITLVVLGGGLYLSFGRARPQSAALAEAAAR